MLTELIRHEIDGKPVQSRLVSAILIGTTIAVPKGKDTGGTFKTFRCAIRRRRPAASSPTRRSDRRSRRRPTHCSARSDANGRGLHESRGAGGRQRELHAYLDTTGRTITSTTPRRSLGDPEQTMDTPWVSVPGLLTAKCTSNENATAISR